MTDLEMTRLCAEAMGYEFCREVPKGHFTGREHRFEVKGSSTGWVLYDPLHDDAQAMALVKKLLPEIRRNIYLSAHTWVVSFIGGTHKSEHSDLNRAIVECVAKMQAGKK